MRARRKLIWAGDARKVVQGFPKGVRADMGYALKEAQEGRKAKSAKPLTGLGAGVLEIVADHVGDTFRAIYAVKLGNDVYVLHAFQKKSKSGRETPKAEIDVVRERLKRVRAKIGGER